VRVHPAFGVHTFRIRAVKEKRGPLGIVEPRRIGGAGDMRFAAAAEFDDRPGLVRDALLAGQKELRGAIAKAVRLAIETGELPADTDPWQLAFELFGIVLAAHHDRHLFDDPRAADRGKKAIERLLAAHKTDTDPSGARSRKQVRPDGFGNAP